MPAPAVLAVGVTALNDGHEKNGLTTLSNPLRIHLYDYTYLIVAPGSRERLSGRVIFSRSSPARRANHLPGLARVFSTAHRLLRAMRGFFCLLCNCYKNLPGYRARSHAVKTGCNRGRLG
jgi:hypothetical protein